MSSSLLTGASLPPRYASWLGEALGGIIPAETEATCDDCAMCSKGAESRGKVVFEPSLKCCTYVPHLPNFVVGGVLRDTDPELDDGRRSLLERIRGVGGVTPFGVSPPRDFDVRYEGRGDQDFGRDPTLRCPHYIEESGRCGIWRHRNAVCTTWYCKHVRGKTGGDFWTAIKTLLAEIEHTLSLLCASRLDIPTEVVAAGLTAGAVRRNAGAERKANTADWGPWAGRIEAYFVRCDEIVRTLSWAEVVSAGGERTLTLVRLARLRHERLTRTEAPIALRLGRFEVVHADKNGMLVSTYSHYDPLELPGNLVRLLPYFDGRQTEDALANIKQQEGVELEPNIVRTLVDFGVLEPSD